MLGASPFPFVLALHSSHVQSRKSASQFCLNYLFDLPASGPRRPAHTRGMWSHKPHFFLCQRCLFSLSFSCPWVPQTVHLPLPLPVSWLAASVGLLNEKREEEIRSLLLLPVLLSHCWAPAVSPGSASIHFAETCQYISPPCKKKKSTLVTPTVLWIKSCLSTLAHNQSFLFWKIRIRTLEIDFPHLTKKWILFINFIFLRLDSSYCSGWSQTQESSSDRPASAYQIVELYGMCCHTWLVLPTNAG